MGFYDKVHVVAKTATQLNPSHRANIKQLAQEISFGNFLNFLFLQIYVTQQKRHPVYSATRDLSSSSLALRLLLLDQTTKRLCTLNSGLESVKRIQNYVKVFALNV